MCICSAHLWNSPECLLLMALHLRKGCLSVPLKSLGFRVPLKSPVVLFLRVPFIRVPYKSGDLKRDPNLENYTHMPPLFSGSMAFSSMSQHYLIGSIVAPFRDYLIGS